MVGRAPASLAAQSSASVHRRNTPAGTIKIMAIKVDPFNDAVVQPQMLRSWRAALIDALLENSGVLVMGLATAAFATKNAIDFVKDWLAGS
jgi:L-fucose isomerase-like protein